MGDGGFKVWLRVKPEILTMLPDFMRHYGTNDINHLFEAMVRDMHDYVTYRKEKSVKGGDPQRLD